MSTNNICFHGEIRKYHWLWIKKSILSKAMTLELNSFGAKLQTTVVACNFFHTLSIRNKSMFKDWALLFKASLA